MTTPILLSHYALIFMSLCPMECRGRKNQEIKETSPDPLPPTGRRRGRVWLRETIAEVAIRCNQAVIESTIAHAQISTPIAVLDLCPDKSFTGYPARLHLTDFVYARMRPCRYPPRRPWNLKIITREALASIVPIVKGTNKCHCPIAARSCHVTSSCVTTVRSFFTLAMCFHVDHMRPFWSAYWNLEYGIWNMEFGIWNLAYGIWNMELGTGI